MREYLYRVRSASANDWRAEDILRVAVCTGRVRARTHGRTACEPNIQLTAYIHPSTCSLRPPDCDKCCPETLALRRRRTQEANTIILNDEFCILTSQIFSTKRNGKDVPCPGIGGEESHWFQSLKVFIKIFVPLRSSFADFQNS